MVEPAVPVRQPRSRLLHRYSVVVAVATFFLLIAGALVTSNDAGLAVPDWPLSYGSLFPPMHGGIIYEHGHRMVAGLVGLLTIGLAVAFWRREQRIWVRRLALAALGLIVVQAILGGITVLFYLPAWVSTAHATVGQLFFCTVVSLVMFTGDWWQSESARLELQAIAPVRGLAWGAVGAIFMQLVLGAAFRHRAFGLIPHLVCAFVVTGLVSAAIAAVWLRLSHRPVVKAAALRLLLLLGVQLTLGGLAYWAVQFQQQAPQPLPLPVTITVAHVVTGALTLAAAVWLALCVERLRQPRSAVLAGVPALQLQGRQS